MFNNLKSKRIRRYLVHSDPDALVAGTEQKVLSSFLSAAKKNTAYRNILENLSVKPSEIKTMGDFKARVPVINKDTYFDASPFNEIIAPRDFPKITDIMTSSGFTGKFAFGANLRKDAGKARFFVDMALDLLFHTSRKKTLLINCTPMGVHVETSLPLAETSVRSDMALAMLQRVSPFYEQTILIGDPFFMKKLVEEGCEAGIPWRNLGVSLVLGQDWFPETLRTYLASLMEMEADETSGRLILATMGLTELGLNVFHESPETMRIRKMAQSDNRLHASLFGSGRKAAGYLFHYYPMRFYIEEDPHGSLLFTTLSKSAAVPLIRYQSGDSGRLVSYKDLQQILSGSGIAHLSPALKLPLASMTGRSASYLALGEKGIYPEDLKLGLFEDHDAAGKTTGYFVVEAGKDRPLVKLQLKEGITSSSSLKKRFIIALQKYTTPELEVKLYPYHEFPYGMELNYEKKFRNLI
jgi:phenylacetate-CoA ligase